MQRFSEWLLAKNINAALVALVCTLLPLISLPGDFLVLLLVAFVTLRKGSMSGLYVLAWVALPSIALLYWHDVGNFDVLLVRSVVIWLMASILHRTRSWSYVLYFLVIVGLAAVIGFHGVIGNANSWWLPRVTTVLLELTKEAQMPMTEVQRVAERVAGIATGLVLFVSALVLFLQLFLARLWQSRLYNPGGLKAEGLNLRVSPAMTLLLCAGVIAALLHISVAMDCLPLLVLPFVIVGMSLLHMYVHHKRTGTLGLVVLYILAFFMPYVLILVALLGVMDSWWDFRTRYQLALKR